MKRVILMLAALLLLPATAAEAVGRNAHPTIRFGTIVASADTPGAWVIPLEAIDPDGVVTELALDFGDGVILQMLLFCDPATTRPGDPVSQEITWSYAPGTYKLRAVATSTPDCFSGPFQDSHPAAAHLKVR
jgi:hypothetical protein